MMFLDELLPFKYSLAPWYINNEDFKLTEFAPLQFNLTDDAMDQFAKEVRAFPTEDGRSRARRDSDGRLKIRRQFEGITKRLKKVNDTEYMLLGDRILDLGRISSEKVMINFQDFEHEYLLNLDIRSDSNFNSLLDSLSSTEPNPKFLEGILQKRDRFTKHVISESDISFVDVTNKYWNSPDNKHSWFEVFYMVSVDSENRDLELRRLLEANFDGGTRKRYRKYQEARAIQMVVEWEAEQSKS
ncbi:MAG: hypothetical protein CXT77_04130 [uncultured DHVE6 group euryarchaeote]|jgi:hypothetical protein|nr:MAG: hypothetical protein CXT77_04130 [uncultured DHVE6 group euryarchaeote]